ncbi:major tail protein [Gordonia phage Birdsong]|nr:major tail protein [Gordonia phage BearBQ]
MAVEHTYVAQSLDGGVYWRAPLGTELPGDVVETSADLDPDFEDQGTAAVDGLSVGITRTTNTVKDFDGGDHVDVQTEYGTTFKIKLLDVDLVSVKKSAFGDANVTVVPATSTKGARYHVEHNAAQLPICSHIFATKSGRKFKTYEIEKGRVSEIAEYKNESQDAAGLELTIRAFKNSNGNYVEEYGDVDGIPTPSGP